MALSLVTGPAGEPVSLAEAKAHCRVDVEDENALISTLIGAARQKVEVDTHRKMLAQTWDLRCEGFPCDGGAIELPFPPVSSVASVTYVDGDGSTQTWSSALYTTDLPTGPWARVGRIVPIYNGLFPVTRRVVNAMTVRFVCGYGVASAVPASLQQAMKLLIGHWYNTREPVIAGSGFSAVAIPLAYDALIWPFKSF